MSDGAVLDTSAAPEPAAEANGDSHDTLKYQLLGPSLTKAGQDAVDQQKVSEVIYNASKGSKFFNNEENRDRNLTEKINRILAHKRQLEQLDSSSELRRADDYIAELELGRDLSQAVVHVDCDAFYAAVEELDRPDLKEVPMAVGKGVLTTCNYIARKYGCRSGMAGFVAMKLCPQLVCLPLNFAKYTAKAEEVRVVLAEYDPNFESASCDEAYLNITEYCKIHDMTPQEVVMQMRQEVHERTKITVSAGIAANAKLAKICSNQNKPNGQFYLAPDRATIMAFMRDLSPRKVNGIGRVFERELSAIGITKIGDLYGQRSHLSALFGQKAFHFLMQCYLGLGRTKIEPPEESERKSVGTESTFRELRGAAGFREKLRQIAEELEKDLERTQYKGRTLCLKIKLHTYEVYTRQMSPPFAVSKADDLYKYALPMLTKLEKEIPGLTLRLMGLRATHIVSTKKAGIDFFGNPKPKSSNQKVERQGEWEVWPEAEFEAAARQELQDDMNAVASLSQELELRAPSPSSNTSTDHSSSHQVSDVFLSTNTSLPAISPGPELISNESSVPEPELYPCPICNVPQDSSPSLFNAHLDSCLSRETIKEAIRATKQDHSPTTSHSQQTTVSNSNSSTGSSSKKRGRPRNDSTPASQQQQRDKVDSEKRRKFFQMLGV